MPLTSKKPLANLSNLIANSVSQFHNHAEKKNNNQQQTNLKRILEDSPSKLNGKPNKKVNNKINQLENNENIINDPTKTIESKIKNISISKPISIKKESTNIKAVKNRSQLNEIEGKLLNYYEPPPNLPANVIDHDRTQLNNIDAEPYYAFGIFEYYKLKEKSTKCEKYMQKQTEISEKMRIVLVDWLVEIQQTFELYHETLYHAIKIMDQFLMRSNITRVRFQLLGMTSIFIAAKLDERLCPMIEDFIYMSDDAYDRQEVIQMEMEILAILEFNLNYPLSYSFLRRYARCSNQTIETLTLSRYILESSLLDYSFVDELDSRMAAASLLLAMKMKKISWNPTLEFYSGYKENDLLDLVKRLNKLIKTNTKYETIRNKYSDTVFFEVTKIRPLEDI